MPDEDLPPFGLRGWPAADLADPYPVYRRYRERAPVHRVPGPPGEPDTHYVFGYDEVVKVLADPRFGRNADVAAASPGADPARLPRAAPMSRYHALDTMIRNWLVFLDPPRHTTVRSLLSREFTPRAVVGLRERMREIADELIVGLRRADVVDLVEEFAAPYPVMVVCELLGVPRRHRAWLRERSLRLQEASSARGGGHGGYARADTAAADLAAFFRELADLRRGGTGDDLISLLVRGPRESGPLSDDEIASNCVHLLTAGHETTTHALTKSVLALLERPDTLAGLRASRPLPTAAVDELVRFDSPVQTLSRWAYRDVSLGGSDIRGGARVVVVLGSANRDPRRFTDPDLLDVSRAPDRHLGFGLGIHYCLGAALARAEVEIGLGALLEFLPDVVRTDDPVPYPDDLIFHGPARVLLRTAQ
ncbi:cytochrome P450 [Embleya sp. AB8]|uniref:cytochrome P450 n=1 Tax=Embleya sp. AB8 TaxID=3156304 RepID=UPI003C70B589